MISDHPYVAVTDKDGKFELKNVPVGPHNFMFWQEKSGYLATVTIRGQEESWRRGTTEIDIKPGVNDMGTIIVKAESIQGLSNLFVNMEEMARAMIWKPGHQIPANGEKMCENRQRRATSLPAPPCSQSARSRL